MTTGNRSVVVKQLPPTRDPQHQDLFLAEVQAAMGQRRPRVVLDCSRLQELDASVMHLMLRCLEEALRRNGDVRLAALAPAAEPAFAAAGLDRLFDVYQTAAEAVVSFQQGPIPGEPSAAEVNLLQTAPAT